MKIRLWRGPFDGKVIESYGHPIELIEGPKPMSRKKRWEYERDLLARNDPASFQMMSYRQGGKHYPTRYPVVEAEYERTHHTHPDGSVFYVWNGRKRELK